MYRVIVLILEKSPARILHVITADIVTSKYGHDKLCSLC